MICEEWTTPWFSPGKATPLNAKFLRPVKTEIKDVDTLKVPNMGRGPAVLLKQVQ